MQKTKQIRLLFLGYLMICFFSGNAQVSEIGLGFKKHGFVQEIDEASNSIDILFITENSMAKEKLLLKNPNTNQFAKGLESINELRYGMELVVEGDNFPKQKLNIANAITVIKPKQKFDFEKARLDDIIGEYAIVDGNRIKLKEWYSLVLIA